MLYIYHITLYHYEKVKVMAVKTEILSVKLDADLKSKFISLALQKDRPASQIVRDLIRLYVSTNEIPNVKTIETIQKTDRGEDLHRVESIDELFNQLGI